MVPAVASRHLRDPTASFLPAKLLLKLEYLYPPPLGPFVARSCLDSLLGALPLQVWAK